MQPNTLPALLATHAEAAALIDRGRIITRAALDLESRRVAQGFIDLGVREGDRVAVWLPNVPAWLACLFACARIGAIVVAVNTRFRVSELQDILGRSGARVLVFWPGFRGIDFARIVSEVDPAMLERLHTVVAYSEADEPVPRAVAGRPVVGYATLAANAPSDINRARGSAGVMLYTTSGTTRAPKFVLHDQRAISVHASHVARAFGFDAPDSMILLTIPLCGTFGLTAALAALAACRPAVMMPSFEAENAADLIARHAVTHFPAAGDIVAQLLAVRSAPTPYPSVRLVIGARTGQAAPAAARGLCLVGVYGMSEVQAMVSRHSERDPPEVRERGGGMLIAPGAHARARDTASGEILAHDHSGELEFRLPSQMAGYFEDDEATRAALTADGYIRSGDLGYSVPGGFVFQSRIGDALRLSGFMVNPLEIEGVLDTHPAVAASQVVGIDGPRGTYPVAFVILRGLTPPDEQAVIAHCAARIAAYKVPKRVFALDAFPVTYSANGTKIQKARLREMARELTSR